MTPLFISPNNFCFNVLIKFLAFSLFVRFVPFCLVAFIRECVHIVYNKNNKQRAATKAYNFITAFITQNCIHAKRIYMLKGMKMRKIVRCIVQSVVVVVVVAVVAVVAAVIVAHRL